MFVDASAIVAILTEEPDADALAAALEGAEAPITSAVAIFEAALGLRRKRHASVEEACQDVRDFLAAAEVRPVPLGLREAELALTAFDRYGRGRGRSRRLGGCRKCKSKRCNEQNGSNCGVLADELHAISSSEVVGSWLRVLKRGSFQS